MIPASEATFHFHLGSTPLLISMPHVGSELPEGVRDAYSDVGLAVADTDFHLDRLYAFARELGANMIVPRYSRYLIDLNRPPDNQPMYAGANNTELCPTRSFSGEPLYRAGMEPSAEEIEWRRARYHEPYHRALSEELARLKERHGFAVLFDAHSIKSHLPWLFPGKLPDLNLGTADGASCAASLRSALSQVLAAHSQYSHALDGRFKGGYITRHYGKPEQGVHALQLEMCWSNYMLEAPPYDVDDALAAQLSPMLTHFVECLLAWSPA
jgi:N-formylglutamate deformylase